jgi:2-methylcitrate dehydratase
MDAITTALIGYATGLDVRRLSAADRAAVGHRLIDGFACAVGGIDGPPVVALRRLAGARPLAGGCTVWGSALRTAPEVAALANGTALRFLDYNDYTVGGHPSDVIPALVAACEWADAAVGDLVGAVTVTYEVFGELGRMLIRYRGWDQSTTAGLAAACGVGRVLRLSPDQLASAIGMVATANVVTGKARRGKLSMWKGVAGPYAAQAGLLAAQMAAAGVTAPHDAFAGEFGFLEQVSGDFEVQRLNPDEGPHHLHRAAEKHWPVHFDLQPAVWLGARIRAAMPTRDIAGIRVEASEWTWKGTAADPAQWAPANRETADHSLPYIMAVALTRGGVGHEDFEESEITAGEHLTWMSRIEVAPAEDITARTLEFCLMRATVTTTDGARHEFEVCEPRSEQMSDAERRAKWNRLTAGSRLAARVPDLLASLTSPDDDQSVRELVAPLVTE